MTKHFNRKSEKGIRRYLRNNMTYVERIIWIHLRKRQLGVRFLRQYSVDKYIIDFYSPEIKLAVEIDGEVHKLNDKNVRDKKRQSYIESFGIRFVRITNEEFLGNPNKAFQKIENVVKELRSFTKYEE